MTLELSSYDYFPPGLIDCKAKNLHHVLSGPSLIHLEGQKKQPVFISILQHGNETVGLYAIQMLLKSYQDEVLPRSISIFVANVDATRENARRLDHQPDYNRMWTDNNTDIAYPEERVMRQVIQEMKSREPFLSVDLHNNSGLNPYYACINKLENQFFHLAMLFSKTVVYFIRPEGVQSTAFSKFCPAVTLECGRPGDEAGVEHAFEFLDACLQLNELTNTVPVKDDLDLFHTVATIQISAEFSFSFSDSTADLYFGPDLEKYNFCEVDVGTLFAVTHPDKDVKLQVINENGDDIFSELFTSENNEIRMRKNLMPSMLTLEELVIRQDCLCYLMERYKI